MQFTLTGNTLTIALEWYEQLWAFNLSNRFEIPLAHITQVSVAEPQSNWMEIRAPGTFLPGVIKAGTYYTRDGREFWYVTTDKNYLTLELDNEPFKRMIFTVERNDYWAEQIRQSQELGQ
jgi:hypothetical protein